MDFQLIEFIKMHVTATKQESFYRKLGVNPQETLYLNTSAASWLLGKPRSIYLETLRRSEKKESQTEIYWSHWLEDR